MFMAHFGFMFVNVFELANILKYSFNKFMSGFQSQMLVNYYINHPEVLYSKHAMVCFESTKADLLNF